MIINFEKEVYETIWTGDVDQILSYDTDKDIFTVKKVNTGIIKTHMTPLDAMYISSGNIPRKPEHRKDTLQYLLDAGLPKNMISDRLGLLKGMKKNRRKSA